MTHLRGHAEQVAALRDAQSAGRLHHAWLLAGPPGVGKALFAGLAARRLLAAAAGPPPHEDGLAVSDDHPIARLIAAGSHPDHFRLERLPKEKSDGLARSITVDQVRGLIRRFATKPALSPVRTVIIDAVDDLERNGANALLKALEEPPADTIFFLVSHAPGRLLPTIRSRCRLLRFGRLDMADMRAALHQALPEADPGEVGALAEIGQGSPGAAVRFAGLDVAALDDALAALVREGDPLNARRSALAKQLALKAAQPRYQIFLERAPAAIAAAARGRTGDALADAITLWEKARGLATAAPRLSLDPQTTVFEIAGMVAALAPRA